MLGFAPLSSVPIGALPIQGSGFEAEGFQSTQYGTPNAAYARTQTATGAAPSTTFGTATFGTTVAATSIPPGTRFGAPPLMGPTKLIITGSGANGDTVFPDVGPLAHATARGGSIALSTAQTRFGPSSIALTGATTANYITSTSDDYAANSGPFTLELQLYLNAYNASGGRIISLSSGGTSFVTNLAGMHYLLQVEGSGIAFHWSWYGLQGGYWGWYQKSLYATVPLSEWKHIAISSDGNTTKLFVEGVEAGSVANGIFRTGSAATPTFRIGSIYGEAAGATNAANAYVQQIRVERYCRYTSAFTPPSAALPSWIGDLKTYGIYSTQVSSGVKSSRGGTHTGFSSTGFGSVFGANYQRPTGFSDTLFGTGRLFPAHPVGFMPTVFGLARLFPFHVAPGVHTTTFGDAEGWQHWDVEWSTPGTRLGTPSTPTDRTAEASGFAVGFVGSPSKIGHNPPTGSRICIAAGRLTTKTGLPRATWPLLSGATGFSTSSTGTPTGRISQRAAWIWTTGVGDVSACLSQRATGFVSLGIGFSAAVMTQRTTGSMFRQRFGLPESDRSNTYKAYGVNASGRIGRPTGACRFNYSSAGFSAGYVGNPACFERHRVRSAPPGAGFGRPLLRRNTQC